MKHQTPNISIDLIGSITMIKMQKLILNLLLYVDNAMKTLSPLHIPLAIIQCLKILSKRHGKSTSTASKLSFKINKVPLLLQNLGYTSCPIKMSKVS